jgi:DNA-binding transcriptional MocR family regulator
MRLKSPWTPRLADTEGSVSQRLIAALSDDIADGRIDAGMRLPAHRDLAYALAIGVGTVTKAYLALERRGLVKSVHGRGMFVAGVSQKPAEVVDLSINVPPVALTDRLLAASLQAVARDIDARAFSAYQPVAGRGEDRRALASWLSHPGHHFGADDVIMTHGAQHALALAFAIAAKDTTTMLTEAITYPAALLLARQSGLTPKGVEIDEEGLLPQALDQALKRLRGSAFVYTTPSLHNPTGRTQSLSRRRAIAGICRDHDVRLIEDEIYAPLLSPRPRPIVSLAPERTIHVAGLSKVLCPGLRIGALVVPPHLRSDAHRALEASATMSSPLSGAIMRQWFTNGTADHVLDAVRHEAGRRQHLATQILPLPHRRRGGFHLLLPLDRGQAEVVRQAATERGIIPSQSDASGRASSQV